MDRQSGQAGDIGTDADLERQVREDLAAAEREGFRLALVGRALVLGVFGLWLLYGVFDYSAGTLIGLSVVLAYLALGAWALRLVRRRDVTWQPYAFIAAEVIGLGLFAATAPLSVGGDVPQIFVFRAYGITYFFVPLAVATLSLTPWLVLWTGAMCIVALWGAFLWIASGMERTVSWGDLPAASSAQDYTALLLDPDFIGVGNRVEESMVLLLSTLLLAYAVHRARNIVRERARAERRRSSIERIFGRYVPEAAAREILGQGGALEPRVTQASILFADIEGFTTLSERHEPRVVVGVLSAFFDLAARVVNERGGVVISYHGDAFLAAFNLPLAIDRPAEAAASAARALVERTGAAHFEGERLKVRIGVATGPVAAGSISGGGRAAYTVYGDTVNLAQRLEELNKSLGTQILVCARTRQALSEPAWFDRGSHDIKGRTRREQVFALEQPEPKLVGMGG